MANTAQPLEPSRSDLYMSRRKRLETSTGDRRLACIWDAAGEGGAVVVLDNLAYSRFVTVFYGSRFPNHED